MVFVVLDNLGASSEWGVVLFGELAHAAKPKGNTQKVSALNALTSVLLLVLKIFIVMITLISLYAEFEAGYEKH
ncbi:hypothetical protein GCM10007414_08300 [Agarivorans gilvus]|uniref:Uncharacterized protein n=1 Tax=Agarivorans gilvus TaxID=680279 RepID=A0ABQ1HZQ3_9ALTE|nr:hypothetical protein GCM10007414_08300 [Agarivorans gilvus]